MKRNWRDFEFGVSRLDDDDIAAVARAFGIPPEEVERLASNIPPESKQRS